MTKKLISVILALLLCASLAVSVSAATPKFIYDDADLLTSNQEAVLTAKLAQYSDAYKAQIVVKTAKTLDRSIDEYLDYFYDSKGVGYGENHDGVLLLICMDVREYRILSNGYAGDVISESKIDEICDVIQPFLSSGHYAEAVDRFAYNCAGYLDEYVNFNVGKYLGISLLIGIAVGIVVVLILRGQLKSVRQKSRADDYMKPGSLKLTSSNEIFLYRNVTRTARPKSSSSGGGGGSRSRGGGKF